MGRSAGARRHTATTTALAGIALLLGGCGQQEIKTDEGTAAAPPSAHDVVTLLPDAPPLLGEAECKVVITTGLPTGRAAHVDVCTPVAYATNPPSSGDHWPVWAAYKAYEVPVPREMYVHNLEHGAVVLAYRCASECPEVLALLEEVRVEAASDPLCLTRPGGPAARLVLTPDPHLDTPVAAAAWGATYTATCLDKPSLARFVAQHYARGPENTCGDGKAIDDPDGGAPRCDDPNGGAPDGGNPEGGAADAGTPEGGG
jgi:Protein of unknown function (DUF3105)